MLRTIKQTNEEFFRLFHGLKIPMDGTEFPVLSRYARKSSKDYVEEQENQIYPCIAIQDYIPVPKKEWFIDMKSYFGGKDFQNLTGYLYLRPIWMEFRYDVSIATKSYKEYLAMQDYFNRKFVYGKAFIFCKQLVVDDTVGVVVPYTTRPQDIPRTDGVYETNYEFTLNVWLYVKDPQEVQLIQKIVVDARPHLLDI
jgi:hypothetical protein